MGNENSGTAGCPDSVGSWKSCWVFVSAAIGNLNMVGGVPEHATVHVNHWGSTAPNPNPKKPGLVFVFGSRADPISKYATRMSGAGGCKLADLTVFVPDQVFRQPSSN